MINIKASQRLNTKMIEIKCILVEGKNSSYMFHIFFDKDLSILSYRKNFAHKMIFLNLLLLEVANKYKKIFFLLIMRDTIEKKNNKVEALSFFKEAISFKLISFLQL